MIAETLYWVVLTNYCWQAKIKNIKCVIKDQPYAYTGSEDLFCGKYIIILETLGM